MNPRDRRWFVARLRAGALLVAAVGVGWFSAPPAALGADPGVARSPRPRNVPTDLGSRYQANYDAASTPAGEPSTAAGYGAAALDPWPEDAARKAMSGAEPGGAAAATQNATKAWPAAPYVGNDGRTIGAASATEITEQAAPAGERFAGDMTAAPLALPPPRESTTGEPRRAAMPSVATLLGSLAVVVALFLFAAWLMRMAMPKGASMLPREAVEVLGRTPLAGRLQAHLVRCGNKMLLISVTPSGAETLTEITDPAEVDRLAGICYQGKPQSASANFRALLGNFSYESSPAPRRRGARRDDDLDLSRLTGEA